MSIAPITARPRSRVDTGIPGLTRRQVWLAPSVLSHSAVVLTFAKLYLGSQSDSSPLLERTRLETTLDLASVLGPDTMEIDLATVANVRHQLAENRLVIESGAAGHRCVVELTFASGEAADAVFTQLWNRLENSLELVPFQTDPVDLARIPVAMMAGILAGTGLLAIVLNAAADGWSLPIWLPSWSDWRIVCGLGGAALAMIQVWLYRRLTCPPDCLELAYRTEALGAIRSGNAS